MSDYGNNYLNPCGPPDFVKDPDSTEDFAFNWVADLDGDTIVSSNFVLPDGLAEMSASNTDTTATIFVSGGSACMSYRITNRIVTAGGRTLDKTIRIYVQER